MKRLFLFALVLVGTAFMLSAQKSKVIGVFQLIENGKYDEAKGIIEDAVKRKSTRKWAKTWYARGLICQDAYRKGIQKNDKDLYELYPDQLYIAYVSFEKTRSFDKRGKYDKLLPSKYVLLLNDFIELGNKHFGAEEYEEAFRAFEHALWINKSSVLTLKLDTGLLYNTAVSAYKSKKWDDAIKYLSELNEYKYSSNVPHLIYSIYMMQTDTASAHKVLLDGINNYDNIENLVLHLVDLLFKNNDTEKALINLNEAFKKDTSNYIYPYTKGLLYQKTEEYGKAIDAYKTALDLPSDTVKVYTGIGTCYYNMGAEMDEKARTISVNYEYLEVKQKSVSAFESAVKWFEKAYDMDKDNEEITAKLVQLYKVLGRKEKIKALETKVD